MGVETMGETLKRLREAAGMSQPQLAATSGIPVGTLRGWEQDRRKPLLDTAARVAKALGVSLDDLAGSVELPKIKAADIQQPKRGRPRKDQ